MEKIQDNNRITSVIKSLWLVFIYLSCDRLCRDMFLWNCGYRMQTINTILSIGVTAFIFVLFIFRLAKNGRGFNRGIIVPFAILYISFLVSTLANTGAERIGRWADSFFFALAPLIMVSLACSSEEGIKRFINSVTWLYIALVVLNISFALFPQLYFVISEWNQENFIGYHSILCFPLTLGVMFALLDDYFNGHRVKAAVYIILFFANQIIVHAGGALIGMAVVALYFIPFIRKRIFERWDLLIFVAAVAVLFAILMWGFDWFIGLSPVEHLVSNVLHKELNLSGRTGIWNGLLKDIYAKPLFGYGLSEGGTIYLDLGYNAKYHPEGVWVHAHNEFLQTLFEGGIVSLLCALSIPWLAAKRLRQCGDIRVKGIFNMTVFSLLLMLQNDQVAYYPWYIAAFACQCAAVISSRPKDSG